MSSMLDTSVDTLVSVNGMSTQEYAFLVDMVDTSEAWFKSASSFYNKCGEADKNASIDQLDSYTGMGVHMARKIHNWAKVNLELNRFPSNYEELTQARTLCSDGWSRFAMLAKRIERIIAYPERQSLDAKAANKVLLANADMVMAALAKSERMTRLLSRARAAITDSDGVIDASKLVLPGDDD